jgi:hypothetical protein
VISRRLLARALSSATGLLIAGACATPDVNFVPDAPKVSHCANQVLDQASGETDIDCGGPDCPGCELGQRCGEQRDCPLGSGCLEGFCQERGCDNQVQDGDETGVDCGGPCKPCGDGDPCGEGRDCSSKVCKDDHCATPACDDGVLNGEEAARDCGGSSCDGCPVGSHCAVDTDCELGVCDEDTGTCALVCPRGTDECDGDPSQTCETNLLTSKKNCGECGRVCDLPHADASCTGGVCQIESCKAPWDRCNTDDADGCETNLSNDADNCGACGSECPGVNGRPTCVDGTCQIECDSGFDDCDGDPKTGCETSVSDVQNCGKCKAACEDVPGKTPYCYGGQCGYTDCPDGFGNCDGLNDDCEQDITNDVKNCGRCGGLCSVANGTADCVEGQCVVKSCDPGYDNCDADAEGGGYANGCESNLLASTASCGKCGVSCDVKNGSGTCQNGTCEVGSCKPGFDNCNSAAADGGFRDGCETDTTSDVDNCGGCGAGCAPANATGKCVDSTCVVGDCIGTFLDCTNADGCETDTATNIQHCGSCMGSCSKAGATAAVCADGACGAPTCDANHLNCDGTTATAYANGCETVRSTSSCGACGQVCQTTNASGAACTGGACAPSCNAGWGACSNPQNGCTTQLNAVPNCGACAPAGNCGGATPSCVQTGSAWHCQATITQVANAVNGNVQGPTLNLTHALAAGSNRLVLVAVVARSTDASLNITQARPNTVTYGSLAMKALGETSDGGMPATSGRSHLFYYYLTDATSPALPASGNQAVVIDGNPTPAPWGIVAGVVQFNGVSQTAPFGPSQVGVTITTAVTAAVAVVTPGSVIYSVTGAHYAHAPTASITVPASSPAMGTLFAAGLSSDTFWGAGAASPPLNPATYTIQWAWQWAQNSVEYAIVIQPAQST